MASGKTLRQLIWERIHSELMDCKETVGYVA